MAARTAAVTWIIITYLLATTSSQTLRKYSNTTRPNQGICKSVPCTSITCSERLLYETYKDCTVVLGNLVFALMEQTTPDDFKNISFPNLREVTGYFVTYRVNGLYSLGQLFPNLARVRGEQLINNYGLIVHDMSTLREIGLYSLLKVDRGGIIVWGVPQACFVNTVDWKIIAPRSRHVINVNFQERNYQQCNFPCTCSNNSSTNHCWNNIKCQIYLEGSDSDVCHEQCLGCRKTRANQCNICRYYTYNGECVSKCPQNTIILPDCQYCVTVEECNNLSGWIHNNSCLFQCPIGYVDKNKTDGITFCEPSADCDKVCETQVIRTTRSIQDTERCVYINGSLEIHIRAVPEAMDELKTYLSRIEEVSGYILIYASNTITSLDFLSSLKRIKGQTLRNGKYSLVVYDMTSLQTLFSSEVTQNLVIDRGTLRMYGNPMLCMSQIQEITPLFPVKPFDVDIPQGMNGYSGGCDDVSVDFQIILVNVTSAFIKFSTLTDPDAHYTILYVRLPPGIHHSLVPETCSESEWYSVNANTECGHDSGILELTSLKPASTYAVCIETYDPVNKRLGRSKILNFTTSVGVPEPPFITELVAKSSGAVVIRWVDHKDYHPHINHYELDVSLIEIQDKNINIKDQCKYLEAVEIDLTHHAVVLTPPPGYLKGCESMCGILSSFTAGAMVEEYFDVCSAIDCNEYNQEDIILDNSTLGDKVRTLVLNLTKNDTEMNPRNNFQIGGLAPYRDYRFRLRACTRNECSRSARSVVRTLRSKSADVVSIKQVTADDLGNITVEWIPPNLSNGPILSYSLEVVPKLNISCLMPQKWCVLANQTIRSVKSEPANQYCVRVCTRSMGSDASCCEWEIVVAITDLQPTINNRWWIGLIFGIVLYTASVVIGYRIKRPERTSIDLDPIIDSESSHRNESEPPSRMFSDFIVMYSIPLRDTRLE